MKERLVSAINEIRNNKSMLMSDEASIKSGVILRLLSILGWNPFDVNEVKPEYTVESKRVDFSLRINGINKVFIEVKRPSENLETHQATPWLLVQRGCEAGYINKWNYVVVLSPIE